MTSFEQTAAEGWPAPNGWDSLHGETILLAVSGGADSVAMFRALLHLNETLPDADRARLIACHFHHGLRGEDADRDATFVEELAQRFDLPCVIERFEDDWQTAPDVKEGIEAAARTLRYDFLIRTAARRDARFVATAHTADDQAETILHRIARGTGVAGLIGIPHRRELAPGVELVRPLLDLTRTDVIAYLEQLGQPYRTDRSNADPRFTRNRIRASVLPLLEREVGSNVRRSLVQLGESAAEIQDMIQRLLDQLIERGAIDRAGDGSVFLPTNTVADQPPYLVRELLVRLWREQGWPRRAMNRKHWTDLSDMLLASYEKPIRRIMPSGLNASRTRYGLLLEPAAKPKTS